MMEILQLCLYGIVFGSIVSLAAIGVSLTFGIMRFANFAHGDLMTFGAYVAFLCYSMIGLPFWIAVPVSIAATIILVLMVDRVFFRPLRKRNPVILLISSFGIALMIRSVVQVIWGPDQHVYDQGIQMATRIAGLRIKPDQITIIISAIALMVLTHLFLTRSKIGKAMRAVSDNPDLAKISGIDTERVIQWTWIAGAGLAAIAGIFLGLDTRLHPEMGWHFILTAFAAAILGGIGNPYGAVAGSFIIGIAMEVSTMGIDPSYKPAVAFAIMVLTLIVRPTGIFAGRSF